MMLRLTDISKTYGGRAILDAVSLSVAPGTLTLVTGANGAGKSTLLHIMAGLVRPDSGTVERSSSAGEVGFLGHETLLYPNLTALENLAFWGALHGKKTDETALLEILDRMNLVPFADGMAGGFSRGMAQRLSLARLLLLSPALVLLDEPLTGLDADSAALVRKELLRQREMGAALVWVSHDPERDAETADAFLRLTGKGGYECGEAVLLPENGHASGPRRPTEGSPGGAVPVRRSHTGIESKDGASRANSAQEPRPSGVATLHALRELPGAARLQNGAQAELGSARHDCGMLRAAILLAIKDIRMLAGRGNVLLQSILLGLLLIVLFSLSLNEAFNGAEKNGPTAAATIFWLCSAFCLTILSTSLFMLEETALARKGLLLSPHPAQFIWLGKTLALLGLLCIIQTVFFLASLVFLDLSVSGNALLALSGVILADIGAAALSSLLASLCRGQAARESLASILVFPLLVPLFLAGIHLLALGYGETDTVAHAPRWLGIVAAFDAIFIAAALTLFPVIYGGEN